MPTITLNYETVKGALKLSDEKLKDRIAMLGTDIEQLSNKGIIVEIFPNRPDLLSEFGFIRAMRSFVGLEKAMRKYKAVSSGKQLFVRDSVSSVRPYTACAIVKNLKLNDEKIEQLIQLQEKLHLTYCRNRRKAAIGIYPSDKLRYPIEFIGEDPKGVSFVPLGETKPMTGLQILSRHKTGREFGHLLEGKSKFPFFRDADGQILSMPPIINSELTGKLTAGTTEVFVECSGFDFGFLQKLLNILLCEMVDMGGRAYSMELVYPNRKLVCPNLSPETMKLDEAYAYRLLGEHVDIKKSLGRMGIDYDKGKASIPCYRVDILHPIDLVEDIAIGNGYENFEPELPNISTIGEEQGLEKLKRKLAELAIGLRINEVFSFNVTSNRVQNELMGLKNEIIEFSNYKSSELSGLRRSMIPSMLELLQANANNEYPQRIFDMGTVFAKGKTETGVLEQEYLCVALAGNLEDFTKAKQVLEYLLNAFGKKPKFKELLSPEFIIGRAGEIHLGNRLYGRIGEIHPSVLNNFKLETPVAVFELNISRLLNDLERSAIH